MEAADVRASSGPSVVSASGRLVTGSKRRQSVVQGWEED